MINSIKSLIMGYVEVKRKTAATLSGLLIDEKLSFKQHVNAVC